jgi:cytochrome c-type biogenesis protein CcmE
VASVIVCLIGVGVAKSASYDMTVEQVVTDHLSPDAPVTVSGTIVGSSVRWLPDHENLEFAIHDKPGSAILYVKYHGLRPDDFTNGWPVVVTGTVHGGVLTADNLLIKCPSKYSAAPGAQDA